MCECFQWHPSGRTSTTSIAGTFYSISNPEYISIDETAVTTGSLRPSVVFINTANTVLTSVSRTSWSNQVHKIQGRWLQFGCPCRAIPSLPVPLAATCHASSTQSVASFIDSSSNLQAVSLTVKPSSELSVKRLVASSSGVVSVSRLIKYIIHTVVRQRSLSVLYIYINVKKTFVEV